MKVRFFTFEQYHGKKNIGSTRIRVHNLIKHWDEAELYKYGENPDVMVFQKVYMQPDYHFPKHFEGIKILDICDPDWLSEQQNVVETINAVDGVTCPTETLKEFLEQLSDKPVRVIPDRHEFDYLPDLRSHSGKIRKAVWFGFKQNAELLQFAIPTLERRGIHLTVISNDDPSCWRWANDPEKYRAEMYDFKKYEHEDIVSDLSNADVCILPEGNRPKDRFKSNNRTTLCWFAGVPIAKDSDDLDRLDDPMEREKDIKTNRAIAQKDYDVKLSVKDLKQFIDELMKVKSK